MMTNLVATRLRRRLMLIVAFLMVGGLACGSTALAGVLTGVGQNPPPPMGPFPGDNEMEDMIMVGGLDNPIPIVPDPNGPPWMKIFEIDRRGEGWSTSGPGSMITVMEFITFPPADPSGAPLPRIIDWHEDIDIDPTMGDGADFKWAGGVIELFGSGAPPIPGMVSDDGKSIWFDFPPFPPGLPIKITKQLMWAGDGPITGSDPDNIWRIKVNERPSVPEPATLSLAGLAAIGVAGLIRRRKR